MRKVFEETFSHIFKVTQPREQHDSTPRSRLKRANLEKRG